MSQNLCAKTYKLRQALLPFSLLFLFVLPAVALFGNTGCEDKAIGRSCDVLTDASAQEGVYNSEALDCPSRICLKPVVELGAAMPANQPTTTAYCSASCSQDSDCNGQIRDTSNPLDTRCILGFTCAIPFVKGKLCCQKLCVCKDFLCDPTSHSCQSDPSVTACNGNQATQCQ